MCADRRLPSQMTRRCRRECEGSGGVLWLVLVFFWTTGFLRASTDPFLSQGLTRMIDPTWRMTILNEKQLFNRGLPQPQGANCQIALLA